jgi:proton-dependent oligopeptide transporter, POT family
MEIEVPSKPFHLPRSTWFIVSTEACERFSFYGMTSILTLYLQYQMGMGTDGAKERVHLFNAGVYYLPLLGGWLADKYFGRYKTILFLSLFYCLGHGALALYEGKLWGIYLGLALIAVGAGGIKPCVSAFVADQFESLDERGLSKVYGIFYWAVNLGAAFAFAIIPAVAPEWSEGQKVSENWGYSWAFGIPGIFMAIAALVFWLGTPLYVKKPPQVETDTKVDPALRAEDRKTLVRIIAVLSPIVIFWALFYQLNTSWVQQGDMMQPFSLGSYKIDGQRMQAASGLLILILVPFMVLVGYPLMRRVGLPTTLTGKITIGMLVTALAFVISGLLQNALDQGNKLSVLWQLVPYLPLEIGEVMVSVTGLEFAYANAPPRMKSVVMGVWFGITGTGNLSVAILTALIGTSTVNSEGTVVIPDDNKYFHLTAAQQFYFYAILMLLGAAAFVLISRLLMQGRTTMQPAEPPKAADEL